MPTLYNLAERYQNITDLLDNPEIDQATIINALAVVESDLATKAGNIAVIIRSMDADCDIIKAEEKRLAERRRAIENRRDWLKGYVREQMERIGLTKIKTPTFTISLQNNPPALQITDEASIPASYLTIIPEHTELNKEAIKAALKAGEEVPGATLAQGKSLRIR